MELESTKNKIKTMKKLFFIVAAALTMVGCNNKYEFFNGQTQGTTYHIIMQSPTADIQQRIDEVLTQIDTTLSIFNPNSQISRFNRGEVTVVSKDFENCINQARTAFIFSKGMYDITIAPLVDLWGFGPSGKRDVEPTQAQIDSVLQFVDQTKSASATRMHSRMTPVFKLTLARLPRDTPWTKCVQCWTSKASKTTWLKLVARYVARVSAHAEQCGV